MACAGRIFDLIETPARTPDPENPEHPETICGAVDIENVKFSYTPEKPLIDNFNLSVQPGMKIAIVGPTGCGKTTFLSMLAGLDLSTEGEIIYDGKSTAQRNRDEYRLRLFH